MELDHAKQQSEIFQGFTNQNHWNILSPIMPGTLTGRHPGCTCKNYVEEIIHFPQISSFLLCKGVQYFLLLLSYTNGTALNLQISRP